jgi:hypothetical protein
MRGRFAIVALVVTGWLIAPARAEEKQRTAPVRAFDRFELESETVEGFWAEIGALVERTDTTDQNRIGAAGELESDETTAFARLAYGGEKWEGNLFVPYVDRDADLTHGASRTDMSENGIGDVQLSGKYVFTRSDLLDFGVGGLASLPSGDDDERLGTGEFGGMPYITGALNMAIVDLRGHFGGLFFSGNNTKGVATNRVVYGGGIFAPVGKYVTLRNEFNGVTLYDEPDSPKAVSYVPGADLRIPIGGLDLLVRVTGVLGLSSGTAGRVSGSLSREVPDWGIGGSLVLTSPTMRAPSGSGGIAIE